MLPLPAQVTVTNEGATPTKHTCGKYGMTGIGERIWSNVIDDKGKGSCLVQTGGRKTRGGRALSGFDDHKEDGRTKRGTGEEQKY